MNIITAEEAVMFSFHLFMLIECNACCVFRELFNLETKDMAEILQHCSSLLNKLEQGKLADGHDLKEDYMRSLGLGITFTVDINSDALKYYIFHYRELLREKEIIDILFEHQKINNKKLMAKCLGCRNDAMRIAVLITIAEYYDLKVDYQVERIFNPKTKNSEKLYIAGYNAFEESVLRSKEEKFALKKEQLLLVWEQLEHYKKSLKRKRNAFLKMLEEEKKHVQ